MVDVKKRIEELFAEEEANDHNRSLEVVARYVYGLALLYCGDDVNWRDIREHADDFFCNDMVSRMKDIVDELMEADGIEITDPFEDAFGE